MTVDRNEYETDVLLWSEHQGALLRRLAAGETVNDAELDWTNIAEEIESVGRGELAAVRTQLTQALTHMLKAEAWPLSRDAAQWRSEALGARFNATDAYAPSMRQRIDMEKLYSRALQRMPETIDGLAPLPVPDVCPVTLDELLSED